MDHLAYLLAPSLLIAVVFASVWLSRWQVPVILVALGAGIVAGSDVLNLWPFQDVGLTSQLANIALVFILFHGGLVTERQNFRAVALPAGGLATWGVLLTAGLTWFALRTLCGWSHELSLLLAVIISSTDAAAIFSILRTQSLPRRLSSTVEIESAANDPMAILLTVVTVTAFSEGQGLSAAMLLAFLWKFTAGPVLGYLIARAAIRIFNHISGADRGYYYVLYLSIALLTYGLSEAAHASGMLAVFTAGFVMGNRPFVYKQGVINFSRAFSTIANIGMFVMMGLLVNPSEWSDLWLKGVVLFVLLTFFARPLAVFLGTAFMGFSFKDKLFASWAGLRGAVPIVLATYPAAAGLDVGREVFNIVFFVVILSILLQGSTLGPAARLLGLSVPARPPPLFVLELLAMAKTDYNLFVIDLPDPKGAPGSRIRDLDLPEGAVITFITRGDQVILPQGNTCLQGWDQVTVLAHTPDAPQVEKALLEPFAHRASFSEC